MLMRSRSTRPPITRGLVWGALFRPLGDAQELRDQWGTSLDVARRGSGTGSDSADATWSNPFGADFDGGDYYDFTGGHPIAAGAGTVIGVLDFGAQAGQWRNAFSSYDSGTNEDAWRWRHKKSADNGKFISEWHSGSVGGDESTAAVLQDGTPNAICTARDASGGQTVYLDGHPIALTTRGSTAPDAPDDSTLRIGRLGESTQYLSSGTWYLLLIYDRELSSEECAALYRWARGVMARAGVALPQQDQTLAFSGVPSSGTTGSALDQFTVTGAPVGATVTLSSDVGSITAGATAVAGTDGVATFASTTLDTAGSATLTATVTGDAYVTHATSAPIAITWYPVNAAHAWRVSQGSGSTIADEIGSTDLAIQGVEGTDWDYESGGALWLETTDCYLEAGTDAPGKENDYQVCVLVRATSTNTDRVVYHETGEFTGVNNSRTMLGSGNSSARDQYLRHAYWDENEDNVQINPTATSWRDGAWHTIGLRRTGDLMEIFVDGVLEASTTSTHYSDPYLPEFWGFCRFHDADQDLLPYVGDWASAVIERGVVDDYSELHNALVNQADADGITGLPSTV